MRREWNRGGQLPFERFATHFGSVSTRFKSQKVLATLHNRLTIERGQPKPLERILGFLRNQFQWEESGSGRTDPDRALCNPLRVGLDLFQAPESPRNALNPWNELPLDP